MAEGVQVVSSEGTVPSSVDSPTSFLYTTASTPWNMHYSSFSKDSAENSGSKGDSEESEGSEKEVQEDADSCSEQLVLPTPIMAQVPYRRALPSSLIVSQDKENRTMSPLKESSGLNIICDKSKVLQKKSSPKLQQIRKPLRTIFDECKTPLLSPSQMTDSEDEMLTPVSSRSSSGTSIASSISPITPLNRYQKRLKQGEHEDEPKIPPVKLDLKVEYQQLVTKYFKAKKIIRRLRDQNKYDQKRIALLEFSRQQDAVMADIAETSDSQENLISNEQDHGTGCNEDNIIEESEKEPDPELDKIKGEECEGGCDQEGIFCNETSQDECHANDNTGICIDEDAVARNENLSEKTSFPDIKSELVQRMAAVISDQSLRPVIFNVPLENPPCKMKQVIQELCRNGRRCASCGKTIVKKWTLDK